MTRIKERAARLREAGERQVAAHLAAQLGRRHKVLLENPHMGRTEQFAEVTFRDPQPEGQIVETVISGVEGAQLTA